MSDRSKLLTDSVKSFKVWRVWMFLGIQDVKLRFRRSFIGPLWIFLNLAIFVGGAGVVYGLIFGLPMKEFLPFLTAGFVIWGFIFASLSESGLAFVNAEGYIKQFSYPKQIYLMRTLVVFSTNMLIGLCVLVLLQLVLNGFFIAGWLRAIPGLLLLLLAGLGHIVICAYLGTRFRDLPHASGGILQVVFFVTPILFPVKVLRDRQLDFIYQYNPLYYLIDIVRHPLLEGSWAQPENYLIVGAYVVAVWTVGALVAHKLDPRVVYLL